MLDVQYELCWTFFARNKILKVGKTCSIWSKIEGDKNPDEDVSSNIEKPPQLLSTEFFAILY